MVQSRVTVIRDAEVERPHRPLAGRVGARLQRLSLLFSVPSFPVKLMNRLTAPKKDAHSVDPVKPPEQTIPRMGLTETLTCGCTVPGRVYAG